MIMAFTSEVTNCKYRLKVYCKPTVRRYQEKKMKSRPFYSHVCHE